MSAPTILTPHETDLIKMAAGIVHVLDNTSLHPILRQTTPLTKDQIDALGRDFSDGLDHWDRDVHARKTPSLIDSTRIAIVADMLSHKYTDQVRRDGRGELTLPVSDIVDAWQNLSGDITRFEGSRAEWENRVFALFPDQSPDANPNTTGRLEVTGQRVGMAIARSIGIDGIFNNVFEAGEAVEAPVPPLPNYPANDERSKHLQLMAKLQLELRVTKGLLEAITPDEPHEKPEHQVLDWFKKRANTAIGTVTHLVVPSGISSLNSQLSDSQKVLNESEQMLETCLYGSEAELASVAAQHRVEHSVGTILFLSICPNVPLIIPTIELRLIFTKPIYYLTKSAHDAMGDIPIFGFPFYLLFLLGRLIDAIPRAQVRFVQGIVTDRWLANPRKRADLIHHYLRHADKRATKPRTEAIQRVLLSIVS